MFHTHIIYLYIAGRFRYHLPNPRLLSNTEEWSQKRLALEALRKLREYGGLDEHHRPPKMSTAASVLPCLERGSLECGKRHHPRMSEALFMAVNEKKIKLAEVLKRGSAQGKDPKSIFNDCAPLILGRTLEKSDFEYREVAADQGNDSGNSGCFRCTLELRGRSPHVFRAGEPGKSKKEGERNAAAAALAELQEILGISTAACDEDAPEVPENRDTSGLTCDEDAVTSPRKDSATWRRKKQFPWFFRCFILGM